MLNVSLLLALLLITINQDILILNEETLILFCFISFCSLIYTNYNISIWNFFVDKKNQLLTELLSSYKKLNSQIDKSININKSFLHLHDSVEFLKKHTVLFNTKLLYLKPIYEINQKKLLVLKKLEYAKRLQKQLSKLIVLILIRKIKHISNLQFKVTNVLNIKQFKTLQKIRIREYLEYI